MNTKPTFMQRALQFLTLPSERTATPSHPKTAQPSAPKRMGKRTIAAASFNRLTPAQWQNLGTLEQTPSSNYVVRQRARDLERTNDFAERFLKNAEANIPGPNGFTFQSNVRELKQVKQKDGTSAWVWQQDTLANSKIEEAFADFCRSQNYLMSGIYSKKTADQLITRMWMRDGEVFIRIIPDTQAKYGVKFQILEAESVDELLNVQKSSNGNVIKMGVEIDEWRRPVNYYVRKQTPSSLLYGTILSSGSHDVIPASQMIHLFAQKYPNQTRGISELVQSMVRMQRLSDYEDAVLINAQISASKMGFFSDKDVENPDDLTLGASITATDPQGNEYQSGDQALDVSPGSFEDIGAKTFTQFAPEFPSAQHEMVFNTTAHGFSAGLGDSYASLTNDLGDTSYSSARVGMLAERELWKIRQTIFTERVNEPIFATWLQFAILAGALNLPMSKYDKFNVPNFIGRRWGWVDPLKDSMAAALDVEYGFDTRTQILAERGKDISEVNAELAQEAADAENAGVKLKFHEKTVREPVDPSTDPPPGKNQAKQDDDEILIRAATALLGRKKKTNGHAVEA